MADALLAVLDNEVDVDKLKTALDEITLLLGPLLALGSAGQPNIDALRPVARAHGPAVTSLIKSMGARLASKTRHNHEQLLVFGEAASIALNALDCLRPVLKASQHELDVQRYNIVRKMAISGLHEHALAQGKVLLASVAASPGTVAGPADLHIAAIANLLVCYSELVKQRSGRAESLWSEICGPVDGLLSVARDAADHGEAVRRLEPVLKCLSIVVEALQYASVICNLSSSAVAQQLSALTSCSTVCRQEREITQMLVDDAAEASDTVQFAMADALVRQIASSGSLSASLQPMLHQLVVSLAQKQRVGHPSPLDYRLHAGQPLASVLRAAMLLPHCSFDGVPDGELRTLLVSLRAAAAELAADSGPPSPADNRLRWCCLDGLRVAIAGVQPRLQNAPQSAGGNLPVLSQCMELLCAASFGMIGSGDTADVDAAVPSGTSALAIAVRLQIAHALCTGQLSALSDEMSRSMELLKRLVHGAKQRQRLDGCGVVGPDVLHSLSAKLGNAGLDLLQMQHAAPAAVLLQAAAEAAFQRIRHLLNQGSLLSDADASQLVKKCKAHVMALQQLSSHEAAMAAAASYVAQLHAVVDGKPERVCTLVKHFVQSSFATFDTALAAAFAAAPPRPAATSAQATAAPAAPCKGNKRGGRLQRMQTDTLSAASQGADQPDSMAALAPTTAEVVPQALVHFLAASAREKGGRPALLSALDMYAAQELEVVREESKRREEKDDLQARYSAVVLDTLNVCTSSAGGNHVVRARMLLVKAITSGASLDTQVSDLRTSCELLDEHLAGIQQARPSPSSELGLLDSAALAHAQLGLCLAQSELTERNGLVSATASGHISQAITLWGRLLAAHTGNDTALLMRMPHAALHAALQVQQLVHLYGAAHPGAARFSGEIVWRLVRILGHQVKLREQDAYLLCATMPFTTCMAWALGVQPTAPLAEAVAGTGQQHGKLAEVLKVTEPIRSAYATDATDHVAVAGIADACAMELECSGVLRHGPAPLLLRSQCHQLASAAYLRGGKTVSAYAHAQQALNITCGLFTLLECPSPWVRHGAAAGGNESAVSGAAANGRTMTPAEAAAAAVKSGALTSAMDYASGAVVTEGNLPGSADRQSLGSGAGSSIDATKGGSRKTRPVRGFSVGLAWAVAAAHIASLHNAARVFEAMGCVEDAICLWKECSRTAELFGSSSVQSLCCAYLTELSCRRDDTEAAAAHLESCGLATSMGGEASALQPGGAYAIEVALLVAHLRSARARLALLRQQHRDVDDACKAGLAACGAALVAAHQQMQGCSIGCTDASKRHEVLAWHGVCMRAQLERLRAEALLQLGRRQEAGQVLQAVLSNLQQAAASCSKRSAPELWPVDYGLVLTHYTATTSPVCNGSAAIVGLGSLRHDGSGTKDCSEQASDSGASCMADGSSTTDQSSKRGCKANATGGSSKSFTHLDEHDAKCPGAARMGSSSVVDALYGSIPAVLQSLRLCWEVPLAAVYACRQLLNATISLGMPYAATMFLHLGHGMSYSQQQALQKMEPAQCTNSGSQCPSGTDASDRHTDRAAVSAINGGAAFDRNASTLMPDVREAALSMLSSLELGGGCSVAFFAALESGAETWLRRTLSVLPPGGVVCAITQDREAGKVFIGRAAREGAPLLAVLPGLQSSEPPKVGSSAGHVLDHCVARLRELLDESGDSMQMDQNEASLSQSHKAKWWKRRLALDAGVKGLLQELDEQCLGPWRCLLLSIPRAHLDAWRAAADAFIKEHFSSVMAEAECGSSCGAHIGSQARVLRELLAAALSGMRHLQGSDLSALLGVVCGQLGSPAESSASSLAVELAAAEAAARLELLKLQPAERGTGCDSANASGSRCDGAPAAAVALGRPAASAASARSTISHPSAALAARARPGATAGTVPATSATAPRQGLRDASRRLGAASYAGAAEAMDGESAPPASTGALDAIGRTRRTMRAAAAQPEPPSSLAATSKITARGASTRLGTRSRTGTAALSEDPIPALTKADSARGTAAAAAAPELSFSAKAENRAWAEPFAGPVLLVLSPALHALPWESIPCCQGKELYRIMSLPVACATAAQRKGMGGFCGSSASAEHRAAGQPNGRRRPSLADGDKTRQSSVFYVLNPSGDLTDTQSRFKPILEAQPQWEGIIGERPSAQALLTALNSRELFLYFGHGSGEQFLPLPFLRKLERCATCLLMGCSSGRLRLHGAYDPSGAVVAYLLAGCPALVANLWDVTDRDIDRYCQALMHAWLGCSSGEAGSAKPERSYAVVPGCEPLGLAATWSRSACKLTHLIGAAPVCYGLPPKLG